MVNLFFATRKVVCTLMLIGAASLGVQATEPTHATHSAAHSAVSSDTTPATHSAEGVHGTEATHATEASHDSHEAKPFDATKVIFEHIGDAHSWHLWGEGHHAVSIPLPVILKTNTGLHVFSSAQFHHDAEGKHVVEVNGERFVNFEEKIYYASETPNAHGQYLSLDETEHPTNAKPLDFSITKNVASMLLSVLIIVLLVSAAAKAYRKNGIAAPKGIQSFLEPIVLFVRDDIAKPNIGEKADKFVPFLLTIFFFIFTNNLLGLLPAGANLTGNIAVTLVLATITFIVTNVNGSKDYWKHVFMPPVPWWMLPIMIPVEIIGLLSKPFALMVRLFANITAGHIIVISLISLIFIFKTIAIAPVSVGFVLFMDVLELLVAFLQAYIFTMLTALFIGGAVATHEHEHEHGHEHH